MNKRRVTSFDVASKAGVSRSVVSAVLNGTPGIGVGAETRQAVLEAIRDLNYEVNAQARGMRTGISHCIAVQGNTENQLFLQVLEGIQAVCVKAGYHVLLYGEQQGEAGDRKGMLNLYRQGRIDGIITLDHAGVSDVVWADTVREANVPYVSIEGYPESDLMDSVVVDYGLSVSEALDYMSARRANPPVYLQFLHAAGGEGWAEVRRREAYTTWMNDQGKEAVVIRFMMEDEEELFSYLRSWRTMERIPSLLINWSVALNRVIRMANDLGFQMGEHYKLMALDNTLRINRLLIPSVACMEIPYSAMGRLAGERLLSMLDRKTRTTSHASTEPIRVKAELFQGESL